MIVGVVRKTVRMERAKSLPHQGKGFSPERFICDNRKHNTIILFFGTAEKFPSLSPQPPALSPLSNFSLIQKEDFRIRGNLHFCFDLFLHCRSFAQPEQPQEQECLPFSLFLMTIAAAPPITTASAAYTAIAAIFCDIHSNISNPRQCFILSFPRQRRSILILHFAFIKTPRCRF